MLIKINWSKLLDGLAWISCGYGVRPRYTVFLSCFLIILFALLFWAGDGIVVEPLNGSSPSIASQENLTFLDNLYFSAMVFTAKTQVKWYPVGIYRYLATVESDFGLAAFSPLPGDLGQNHDPLTLRYPSLSSSEAIALLFVINNSQKYPFWTDHDKRREKSLYWFAKSTMRDIAKGKHHRSITE